MADADLFDGGPPAATPTQSGSSPGREHGRTPVEGAERTGSGDPVKSSADFTPTKTVLTDAAAVAEFVIHAVSAIHGVLGPWVEDEVTKAVFTAIKKARREPERFPTLRHVQGYALKVALNAGKRKCRRAATRETAFGDQHGGSDHRAPDQIIADRELGLAIGQALRELPESLEETFIAIEVDGVEPRDFAKAHGLATQTVYNNMSRARKRLRRSLIREGTG